MSGEGHSSRDASAPGQTGRMASQRSMGVGPTIAGRRLRVGGRLEGRGAVTRNRGGVSQASPMLLVKARG